MYTDVDYSEVDISVCQGVYSVVYKNKYRCVYNGVYKGVHRGVWICVYKGVCRVVYKLLSYRYYTLTLSGALYTFTGD